MTSGNWTAGVDDFARELRGMRDSAESRDIRKSVSASEKECADGFSGIGREGGREGERKRQRESEREHGGSKEGERGLELGRRR